MTTTRFLHRSSKQAKNKELNYRACYRMWEPVRKKYLFKRGVIYLTHSVQHSVVLGLVLLFLWAILNLSSARIIVSYIWFLNANNVMWLLTTIGLECTTRHFNILNHCFGCWKQTIMLWSTQRWTLHNLVGCGQKLTELEVREASSYHRTLGNV